MILEKWFEFLRLALKISILKKKLFIHNYRHTDSISNYLPVFGNDGNWLITGKFTVIKTSEEPNYNHSPLFGRE